MYFNRFIARSTERSLPFLRVSCGAKDFAWGQEQETTFDSLKAYLTELITMVYLDANVTLLLYVFQSHNILNVTLVQKKEVDHKAQ